MKKIFYILGVLLFSTAVTFGQQGKDKVSYGVRGGLNYSNLIYEFEDSSIGVLDFNSKVGFYIGGFATINLSDKFSLQPELIYSSRGAKLDVDFSQLMIFSPIDDFITQNQNDINIKQSSLLVPILLKYSASDQLNLYVGPQITYLLNFENELENGNEIKIFQFSDNDKIGVDIAARIGYSISDKISLELSYSRSLNNLNSFKFSVFQLGLNYQL